MKYNNLYRDLNKEEIRAALYRACHRVDAPEWAFSLLSKALEDDSWDWFVDFDGCSIVQDPTHPYMPCFIHDWMWRCGLGQYSHKIFYNLLLIFEMPKSGARTKTALTWIGWWAKHKWTHKINGNAKPITKEILRAIEDIKK